MLSFTLKHTQHLQTSTLTQKRLYAKRRQKFDWESKLQQETTWTENQSQTGSEKINHKQKFVKQGRNARSLKVGGDYVTQKGSRERSKKRKGERDESGSQRGAQSGVRYVRGERKLPKRRTRYSKKVQGKGKKVKRTVIQSQTHVEERGEEIDFMKLKDENDRIFAKKTLKAMGASDQIIEALNEKFGITKPTRIQSMAFNAIMERKKNVFLGEQTGSGKTLAYLMPVMQSLKKDEEQNPDVQPYNASPKAIVLVPNRELGEQVYETGKAMSHFVKTRCRYYSGGKVIGKNLKKKISSEPVDILIGTQMVFDHNFKFMS
eukprot:TRINITY_DN3485_c0_g1_i2.p1 TRINITY_DN3485_c0_g1~~TRINITY_DN3485_c0_g1_i2.p1  ORF type:complete len:319 (+),score=65.79 TRINITY_DN3485_c0_g1_i2:105-1061(+)